MDLTITPFINRDDSKEKGLKAIKSYIPDRFNRYYDPFVGGGSLFFDLKPLYSVIGDIDENLIYVYELVRDDPKQLMEILQHFEDSYNKLETKEERGKEFKKHSANFQREYYSNRKLPFFAATNIFLSNVARTPYYTKTIIRPPSSLPEKIKLYDEENILKASKLLSVTDIYAQHYTYTIKKIEKNDFIFLDPPILNKQYNGFNMKNYASFLKSVKKIDRCNALFLLLIERKEKLKSLFKDFNLHTVWVDNKYNCNMYAVTNY